MKLKWGKEKMNISKLIQFLEGQIRWLEDTPYNYPGTKKYRKEKISNIITLLKQIDKVEVNNNV